MRKQKQTEPQGDPRRACIRFLMDVLDERYLYASLQRKMEFLGPRIEHTSGPTFPTKLTDILSRTERLSSFRIQSHDEELGAGS